MAKKEVVVHRFYANGKNIFVAERYEPFSKEEILKRVRDCEEMGYGKPEHKELKLFCVTHGISMQEFIVNAVREKKQKWAV